MSKPKERPACDYAYMILGGLTSLPRSATYKKFKWHTLYHSQRKLTASGAEGPIFKTTLLKSYPLRAFL